MERVLQNLKIGQKLPLVIGTLILLTICVMSIANAVLTRQIIASSAGEKLQSVATVNSKRIQSLLDSLDRDIRLQAAAPSTSVALIALADGYNTLDDAQEVLTRVYIDENEFPKGARDSLVSADTGSSYGFIHAIYHPPFNTLLDEMGYYDVFLFDTEGNMVYSVHKERDFATNFLDGPFAETGLGEAYRQASAAEANAPSIFVDFSTYAPSDNAPAAFIARPVFNEQGARLGVLAYQMPITQLSAAAGNLDGLGETADGFLVASDGFLRSESPGTEGTDTLITRVEEPAIAAALAGNASVFTGSGLLAQDVMGFAAPVSFLGAEWVMVVQQTTAELFAGVRSSILKALGISVVVLISALTVAAFFSRGISRPVQNLAHAVTRVAEGALETDIPGTDRRDEIGDLARQTEVFRQNALKIEHMIAEQKDAHEKLTAMNAEQEKSALREKKLAQEKERADAEAEQKRSAMMTQLGQYFGQVVEEALQGNFDKRVNADFDDQVLTDLASDINKLMAAVDQGLVRTGDVLARVAEGNLTQNMEGDFAGAFADLQSNVNGMITSLTGLVDDISESGDTLSGSSSELRQTADVLSRQAEQNAASVEETSAALEELSASIAQVNKNISDVSNNAKEARQTADESETVAELAAASMARIASGSKEITRVTDVIHDIAFQINLLALNAGVEAARAGEAGRGFSVVATEVRLLAQRASEAAKEISQVIAESDSAVSEGVANVANAKSALDGIAERVVMISESVSDVTRAVSEQALGIKEISGALAQVDSNTQKQAAAFEEVTASSHLLASKATDLQTSTSRFQTGNKGARRAKNRSKHPKERLQARVSARPNDNLPILQPARAAGAEDLGAWDEF